MLYTRCHSGGTTQYGEIDTAEAGRAAQEAIYHGITLFDIAEAYGPYVSEELPGKALGTRRKEVVLVTKVGFKYRRGDRGTQCSSFDHVVSSTEACLLRRPAGQSGQWVRKGAT